MSLTTAATSVVAGDDVRILAGTYTPSATLTWAGAGSSTAPVFIRGCDGSGNVLPVAHNADGTLDTTGLPYWNFSSGSSTRPVFAAHTFVQGIRMSFTTSPNGISTGTDCTLRGLHVTQLGASGSVVALTGARVMYYDCDLLMTHATPTTAGGAVALGSASWIVGCRVIVTGTVNTPCVNVNSSTGGIIRCLLKGGLRGVHVSAVTAGINAHIRDNTIVGQGGDGILIVASSLNQHRVVGNMITDTGGWAINAGNNSVVVYRNRFRNNTSGTVTTSNPLTSHFLTVGGNVTTDLGTGDAQDYVTPGSDYNLVESSPAVAANTGGRSIGAFQLGP